jgi:hypothetical protein
MLQEAPAASDVPQLSDSRKPVGGLPALYIDGASWMLSSSIPPPVFCAVTVWVGLIPPYGVGGKVSDVEES